ncbi:hypothetical protein AVEN_54763-1 [Araneus ventricosus]|uniref:Uncharacterized protein n=1 Tax=Araneus ventricosus TaxID=182803 RepID=A0A4Y2IWP0_ARAVE|nr:hypothetical protein AVEN_54763-1 [Araneus ventricosus]
MPVTPKEDVALRGPCERKVPIRGLEDSEVGTDLDLSGTLRAGGFSRFRDDSTEDPRRASGGLLHVKSCGMDEREKKCACPSQLPIFTQQAIECSRGQPAARAGASKCPAEFVLEGQNAGAKH